MTAKTDRELLELAAKAAGLVGEYVEDYGSGDYYYTGNTDGILYERQDGRLYVWNPLTDDGDALRLAVKLRIDIEQNHEGDYSKWSGAIPDGWMKGPTETFEDESRRIDATRRAIVRAAAALGETL